MCCFLRCCSRSQFLLRHLCWQRGLAYPSPDSITELREILQRKAPQYLADAEVFLAEMSYELIPAVYHSEKLMRDAKDQPILNAAIIFGIDIILTGDKDFLSLDIEHPKSMKPSEFLGM